MLKSDLTTRPGILSELELAELATTCFQQAQRREEPEVVEEDARQVLRALITDPSVSLRHRAAVRFIRRQILDNPFGAEPLLRTRATKVENTRHWAIWLMMTHLLGLSVDDPAQGLVFPYGTPHRAAVAVVAAFKTAGLHTSLTVDAVLKQYQRHFNTH